MKYLNEHVLSLLVGVIVLSCFGILAVFVLRKCITFYIVYAISWAWVLWVLYAHIYSSHNIDLYTAMVLTVVPSIGYLVSICVVFGWARQLRIVLGFVLCASCLFWDSLQQVLVYKKKYNEIATMESGTNLFSSTICKGDEKYVYLQGDSWALASPQYICRDIDAIILTRLYSLDPRNPIRRQALIIRNGESADLLITWADVIAYLREKDVCFVGAKDAINAISLLTDMFGFSLRSAQIVDGSNGNRRITICFNMYPYGHETVAFDLEPNGQLAYHKVLRAEF